MFFMSLKPVETVENINFLGVVGTIRLGYSSPPKLGLDVGQSGLHVTLESNTKL